MHRSFCRLGKLHDETKIFFFFFKIKLPGTQHKKKELELKWQILTRKVYWVALWELADFFNAFINIPMYLLYAVLKVNWFTGKTLAIISLSSLSLLTFVNDVSNQPWSTEGESSRDSNIKG